MDLGFVTPDLRKLDRLHVGALVLYLHEDEVPLPDVRGLVDWRLCGTLSRLIQLGRVTGAADEVVLLPVGHRMACERLLLFGLGPRRSLDDAALDDAVRRALRTLARMRVHSAAVALPGRPFGDTDPAAAIAALLRVAPEEPEVDEITLLEDTAGQHAVGTSVDLERRNG
ncbi:MAG: peptidase M17 [Deltaproteobacteria bacterium]|nr:peptidase M17 [Deltaproteobacteria bacterium]